MISLAKDKRDFPDCPVCGISFKNHTTEETRKCSMILFMAKTDLEIEMLREKKK